MRWLLLVAAAVLGWCCVVGMQQGCVLAQPEPDEGMAFFIHWPAYQALLPSNTATVRITVTAVDIAPPIVVEVPRPALPGDQRVTVEVPAGDGRTVTAEAFSATGALLGRDSEAGVVVRPGELTDVVLTLLTTGTIRITIE